MSDSRTQLIRDVSTDEFEINTERALVEQACIQTCHEMCDPCNSAEEENTACKTVKSLGSILCFPFCFFVKPFQACYRVHEAKTLVRDAKERANSLLSKGS